MTARARMRRGMHASVPWRWTCVLSALVIAAVGAVLTACTPMRHTIDPYRKDPAAAREVEAQAAAACRSRRGDEIPNHSFTTDGCSLWIDGPWRNCCVDHDMAYWCGGTYDQRVAADRRLRECVAGLGHPATAGWMYYAVRLGGASWWPFGWRWGYGWDWPGQ